MATAATRQNFAHSNGTVPDSEPSGRRTIRPARALPGGRAVAGGLLVAIAAVGIFGAVASAGHGPTTEYIVATHDIAAGATIEESDLTRLKIDLPTTLRTRAFAQIDPLIGAVTAGPISKGELIQGGQLVPSSAGGIPTFSISVPKANADGGALVRGDVVQVFATYGTDTAATTRLLSSTARIAAVNDSTDSLTANAEIVLRLSVRSAAERSSILNATVTGKLALIRISGVDDAGATNSFRPELDADTAAGAKSSTDPSAPRAGD